MFVNYWTVHECVDVFVSISMLEIIGTSALWYCRLGFQKPKFVP